MPSERRIDRRITVAPAFVAAQSRHDLVVFRDGWSGISQTFDPAKIGLPPDFAAVIAAAFRIHDAGASPRTRRSRWRALRLFGAFLRREHVTAARDIDAGTIQRYLASLAEPVDGGKLSRSTMALRFALIRPLLERVERTHPDLFGSVLAIPWDPFPRAGWDREPKDRLSAAELKAILAAAYDEIDAAWATFQRGRAITASPALPPGVKGGQGLARWVWRLHRLGGGIAPSGRQMRENGLCPGTLKRWGWQEGIAQHFHLTSQTMAPFYVALAIQLAANPDPLRVIRRDCLVPHPIDDDRVMVQWLKRKTGYRPKIQRRSFDRRRPRSAPRLVEMLIEMTQPLIAHAPIDEQACLFLVRYVVGAPHRAHDRPAGLIAADTIPGLVAAFVRRANCRIARWNAEHPDCARVPLPSFTPGQLRGSVATQHYLASGGVLAVAGAVLNHANLVTTNAYVEGPAVRRLEQETIARLQRLMVAWITAPDANLTGGIAVYAPATALFGHRCLAPAKPGTDGRPRVCHHLGGCLTCPGLVVPLDVERLARVLQAQRHLLAARNRIDAARWALFYAPSLQVLEQDLLPAFPTALHSRAKELAGMLPDLPDIE